MKRRFALVAAVCLLATSVGLAAAKYKSISVSGNLNGGTNVSASCSVSSTGLASGAGKLYGNGYSYAFSVNKVTSGVNSVTISGKFTANNAPVSLTARVPDGSQTFNYVVNGKTVTYTGVGTVTIQ